MANFNNETNTVQLANNEVNEQLLGNLVEYSKNGTTVELNFDSTDKESVFLLGILFASGVKIKCSNKEQINERIQLEDKIGINKSLNKMLKFWEDTDATPRYSKNEFDKNKAYVICPVRNATEERKLALERLKYCYDKAGISLHYPAIDTNQDPVVDGINTGGFNISEQNLQAMSDSHLIECYYDKESVGSIFDLGMAYYLLNNDDTKIFQIINVDFIKGADFNKDKGISLMGKVSEKSLYNEQYLMHEGQDLLR